MEESEIMSWRIDREGDTVKVGKMNRRISNRMTRDRKREGRQQGAVDLDR